MAIVSSAAAEALVQRGSNRVADRTAVICLESTKIWMMHVGSHYRNQYTDVVSDGATQSQSTDCGDNHADTDRDVTSREDEVELVVNINEKIIV